MIVTSENIFNNPKLNEITKFVKDTEGDQYENCRPKKIMDKIK